jgi:uncharacterized protein
MPGGMFFFALSVPGTNFAVVHTRINCMTQPAPTPTARPDQRIAARLGLSVRSVAATLELLAGGATVPFIARYRKEATLSPSGNPLDEVEIAQIRDTYQKLLDLDKRREAILKQLVSRENSRPTCATNSKRPTRRPTSKTFTGLISRSARPAQPSPLSGASDSLATALLAQRDTNPEQAARRYVGDAVPTVGDALQGARDILAERISEDPDARQRIRNLFEREAILRSLVKKGKETDGVKFKDYFDYAEPLRRVPSHRLLALRRGEAEGFLTVTIGPDEEVAIERLERQFIRTNVPLFAINWHWPSATATNAC